MADFIVIVSEEITYRVPVTADNVDEAKDAAVELIEQSEDRDTYFEACQDRSAIDVWPTSDTCTCGARNFPSCLCGLSPAQWVAAHPDRPLT